jgi:hypothetical protein
MPQDHVRVALELLDELESQLRIQGVGLPAAYGQGALLAATRRRLWLAVAALESPSDAVRPWVRSEGLARARGSLLTIGFAIVVWATSAVAFVLHGVWRSARVVARVIYTLRAL